MPWASFYQNSTFLLVMQLGNLCIVNFSEINFETLRFVSFHLCKVIQNAEANKMDLRNLVNDPSKVLTMGPYIQFLLFRTGSLGYTYLVLLRY